MRLRRLDLTRYGKFTDRVLDFGERREGRPDLHIIYGPNEAGKSTTLSAFLDLMFGIETRSRYNFLHPYATMRIGGTLEFPTGERQFLRIKRPQNSLLDAREQPIGEAAILGEIGGMDRDAYRTMFSLDDETLEAGGESILASRGDLGQLLFSASTGLADLSNRLIEIRSDTDDFYKFRARSGELAVLKDRLAQLKTEREAIDMLATEHAQLVAARDQASRHYDDAVAERGRSQRRLDEIRRLLLAMPRLGALRELRRQLEPLVGLRQPPAGWAEDLPDLLRQEIELGIRVEALESNIAAIAAEIADITVDETALALTGHVARLAEPRARFVTAEKDLPERRMQMRDLDTVVSGLLQRLDRSGEAEPARLILGAGVLGRFVELMESRSGIDAERRTAERELADARDHLEQAQATFGKMVGGADAGAKLLSPALKDALTAARAVDFSGRRLVAARTLDAAIEQVNRAMAALRPWAGSEEKLAAMQPPDAETISGLKSALDETSRQAIRRAEDAERLTTEIVLLEADLDALAAVGQLVTDAQAAEARAAREAAWSLHRHALDGESAATFESLLRVDDFVAASRLAHVAELAGHSAKTQALAARKAELLRTEALLQEARGHLGDLQRTVAGLITGLDPTLDAAMTLPQLEAWLVRRASALEAGRAHAMAEREFRQAEADERTARERLSDALAGPGQTRAEDAPLELMVSRAQAAVDRENSVTAARTAVETAERDVDGRERVLSRAKSAEAEWLRNWQANCASTWLGERQETPGLQVVREAIDLLRQLGPTLDKRVNLADRIDKMEKDRLDFQSEVEAVAARLGVRFSAENCLEHFDIVETRIRQADHARKKRDEAEDRLRKALEGQRVLGEAVAVHEARRREMTEFFDVSALETVAEMLGWIDKRTELLRREQAAIGEILETLDLTDLGEVEAMVDAADRAALQTELAELDQRLSDLDRRCQELYAEKARSFDRLDAVGGDARVAAIEEKRRTALIEIEEGARNYLKRRLGAAAAEQALRVYRDQHQSAMMVKASEAFSIISRGAYSGLAAQLEKDSETLIAISPNGSKQAQELSKGTRFQLYLALRVAGYHEFVRASGAVPFIADDIMETFDDFRAEEAFRLFGDMARVGQVIYLTHHRHLCDIARRICPDIREHELC